MLETIQNIIDYEIITKTKINDDTKLTRVSRNEVALSFSWLGRNSGVRVKFLTDAKDAPKIRGKVQGHPPFEKNQIVRSSNLIQIIYEEMNSLVNFADNWVKPFLAGFAVLLLLFLAYTYFQITSNGDVIIEVPVEYFVDNIDE